MDKVRRMHREEKTEYKRWIGARYYDHPDGEDLGGKLIAMTTWGSMGGTFFGFVHTRWPPIPTNSLGKALRIARVLIPSIGMAATFTCVTYYATNMREKDDELNYVLGAAAGALVFGAGIGNLSHGVALAFPLSFYAYIKKYAQLNDQRLLPMPIKQLEFSHYYQKHWDTSLLEDTRRGNWTKEPAVK